MPPRSIAILGGGLTGLSSAYHLSRRFPAAQVTLIEKHARLGGWVHSERVKIPGTDASVLLEAGPRTLRPNSKAVLELIHLLRLEDKVITVPKTAPAAKARFLYIPPSHSSDASISGLQRLPSSILTLLSSPLLPLILPAVLREPFKGANRPPGARDESVDAFLSRRFGEPFARTFGSALVHGIYATDSRKLSVRAAFRSVWEAEERGGGSVVRGFLLGRKDKVKGGVGDAYELGGMEDVMREVSVYSFADGMETLTTALEEQLLLTKNVNIMRNTGVSNLRMVQDHSFEISHSSNQTLNVTHVVSALSLSTLHDITSQKQDNDPTSKSRSTNLVLAPAPIPHLKANPMTSVRVVNLVFPCPPSHIIPAGFGYLIPRPPAGYPTSSSSDSDASSPLGILGTVFDSCSLSRQDKLPGGEEEYTKLTMMTGGPYPIPPLPTSTSYAYTGSTPPFIRSLLEELQIQLGKNVPDPVYWRIWENQACIPTLAPGHLDRMAEMKDVLDMSGPGSAGGDKEKGAVGWDGRLAVVGAGVGGVSVGDCVEAGRSVGVNWV
ncbi:protoporphyrinogen oxidase [Crassisporium funariophilum]|nr:protoporphyrinogen oxidase [Crassisporium funariophilum]